MEELLRDNERIDKLYAEDIAIIQSKEVFSFSLDAVLLADFANVPKYGEIVDLCAGNGAVGLFVSKKTNAHITGIEIQEKVADMGRRSITLNQLDQQIQMVTMDLKEVTTIIKKDSVDSVLCNPPYFRDLPTNTKNPNPHLAIARHEIKTNLDDVVKTAASLLKMNGKFSMVHRPERLVDILATMSAYNIAPKRMRFVYPKEHKDANILLIEGIHHGKPDGLKILPPLYVYDTNNNYLPEVSDLLHGNN